MVYQVFLKNDKLNKKRGKLNGVYKYIYVDNRYYCIASLVAAVTPTPKGDKLLAKLYKGIDLLALNIGKAKDKSTKK